MNNPNRHSDHLWILERISKAIEFLTIQKGLNQTEIVEKLNRENKTRKQFRGSDKAYSTSTLSSYRTAKSYTTGLNPRKGTQILKGLESLLSPYNAAWDENSKKFTEIDEDTINLNAEKLSAFFGTWEAYSWDSNLSQIKKKGYIHCFKLKIESLSSVICTTEEAVFTTGRLYLVGTEKVCIEISNNSRRAYFMTHFGSVEDHNLKSSNTFSLAYVDSGRYRVKAGVAMIKRTNKKYEEILCHSKTILQLKSLLPDAENFLKNKQLLLS